MKKLSKHKRIGGGCWPVRVAFCNSEESWVDMTKRLDLKDAGSFTTSLGSCTPFVLSGIDKYTIAICINYGKLCCEPLSTTLDVLSHEASHAVDMIVDYIGDSHPSTEMRAYTIGWLVKEGVLAFEL